MTRIRSFLRFAAAFSLTNAMLTVAVRASDVTGGNFSSSAAALQNFITGTPTKIISIIAIVIAGLALIFGEDLGVMAKRLLMVVIAIAQILGATSIAGNFFGSSAALAL